jgi:hypothetical protein
MRSELWRALLAILRALLAGDDRLRDVGRTCAGRSPTR